MPPDADQEADLQLRVARLRASFAELIEANRQERMRAQLLQEQVQRSRRTRWEHRFEEAVGRHDRELRASGFVPSDG